jgi:hypothetical protein
MTWLLSQRPEWWGAAGTWTQALIVLAGAIIAYFQWRSYRDVERIKATLDYIALWDTRVEGKKAKLVFANDAVQSGRTLANRFQELDKRMSENPTEDDWQEQRELVDSGVAVLNYLDRLNTFGLHGILDERLLFYQLHLVILRTYFQLRPSLDFIVVPGDRSMVEIDAFAARARAYHLQRHSRPLQWIIDNPIQ